jgi:hypothetical protein
VCVHTRSVRAEADTVTGTQRPALPIARPAPQPGAREKAQTAVALDRPDAKPPLSAELVYTAVPLTIPCLNHLVPGRPMHCFHMYSSYHFL